MINHRSRLNRQLNQVLKMLKGGTKIVGAAPLAHVDLDLHLRLDASKLTHQNCGQVGVNLRETTLKVEE